MVILKLKHPYNPGGRYGNVKFECLRIVHVNRDYRSHTVSFNCQYGNVVDGTWKEAPIGMEETGRVRELVEWEVFKKRTKDGPRKGEHIWDAEDRYLLQWLADADLGDHIEGELMEFVEEG